MEINNTKLTNTGIILLSIVAFILAFNLTRLGGFAVLILLVPFGIMKKVYISYGKMQKLLIGYVLYAIFITLLNYKTLYNGENARNLLTEYTIGIVALLILEFADQNELIEGIRNFGIVLSVLGVIESILGYPYLQFIGHGWQDIGQNGYRIQLIFGRSILYGTMLILFWSALYFYPLKNRRLNIIAQILLVYNIIVNQTRSMWIAFVVELLIIWILKPNKKKISIKYVWLGIFAIVILLTLNAIGINILGKILGFISTRIKGSLEAGEGQIVRLETISSSFLYWFQEGNIAKFVFGGGKNYDKVFLHIHPVIKGNGAFVWNGAIDSQFFTSIHECGIVGLCPIVYIIVLAISRIKKITIQDRLSQFSNITLIGISICFFFYEGFNYIMTFWVFALLIALSDRSEKRMVDNGFENKTC